MLDTVLRPVIDPPLNAAGRLLARCGATANVVTFVGMLVGLLAAAAVVTGSFRLAFVLIVLNRIVDGLDGAVARVTGPTDSGGYFDIVADYVFYASVPVAFAVVEPSANAVAAAVLLGSFCLTCASFLAFATIAAKRGVETAQHGRKSFFYSTGLIEGTETIVFLLVVTAFPAWFAPLALLFSLLCVLTAVQRSLMARALF